MVYTFVILPDLKCEKDQDAPADRPAESEQTKGEWMLTQGLEKLKCLSRSLVVDWNAILTLLVPYILSQVSRTYLRSNFYV